MTHLLPSTDDDMASAMKDLLLNSQRKDKSFALACQCRMAHLLMKENGVKTALELFFNLAGDAKHPNLLEPAIAGIVYNCRVEKKIAESYFHSISKQVIDLYTAKLQVPHSASVPRIASHIICEFLRRYSAMSAKYLQPLFLGDLKKCISPEKLDTDVFIPDITSSLNIMFMVFSIPSLDDKVLKYLDEVMHPLYILLVFCERTKLLSVIAKELKAKLMDLMVRFFKLRDTEVGAAVLQTIVDHADPRRMHSHLYYDLGDKDAIRVIHLQEPRPTEIDESMHIVEVIEETKDVKLTLKFINYLITIFNEDVKCKCRNPTYQPKHGTYTVELLAASFETFTDTDFKCREEVIKFTLLNIQRELFVLKETTEEETREFSTEILNQSLWILSNQMDIEGEITEVEKKLLKEILAKLMDLKDHHPNEMLRYTAIEAFLKISHKNSDLMNELQDAAKKPKSNKGQEELLREVKTTYTSKELKMETSHKGKEPESDDKKFKEALELLSSNEVAFRGGGLIEIRKLLQRKSPTVLSQSDTLLETLVKQMMQEDDYNYGHAIAAISALAQHRPEEVILFLAQEYTQQPVVQKTDRKSVAAIKVRTLEDRLKLGEVMMKTIKSLGEMVFSFRTRLLPVLFVGAKDPEPLMRASVLSNLSDLCRMLRFNVTGFINELLEIVEASLRCHEETAVRKAAARLIKELLEELDMEVFQMLGEQLRPIYRLLKQAKAAETDEGVLQHIDMALQVLHKIMQQFLFPKPSYEKKHLFDNCTKTLTFK